MGWIDWATKVENVVLGGWGEDILLGVLLEVLEQFTPQDTCKAIDDGRSIVNISDKDWNKYRKVARHLNMKHLLVDKYIMDKLRKERPDLVSIILNHPQGLSWLNSQIDEIKRHLNLIPTKSTWIPA